MCSVGQFLFFCDACTVYICSMSFLVRWLDLHISHQKKEQLFPERDFYSTGAADEKN